MDDFSQFEDPLERRRRRKRREMDDAIDEAWAAAEQDDIPDEAVEVEDLAAGYVMTEQDRQPPLYVEPLRPVAAEPLVTDPGPVAGDLPVTDLGPLPPSAQQLVNRTANPTPLSAEVSPSDYSMPGVIRQPRTTYPGPRPGLLNQMPFWGVFLLVVLGFFALLAVILAIAAIVTLAG